MYKEYDVIKANKSLTDRVKKGTLGTILIIYEGIPLHYEVEFVDNNKDTIEVLTVSENDIEFAQLP